MRLLRRRPAHETRAHDAADVPDSIDAEVASPTDAHMNVVEADHANSAEADHTYVPSDAPHIAPDPDDTTPIAGVPRMPNREWESSAVEEDRVGVAEGADDHPIRRSPPAPGDALPPVVVRDQHADDPRTTVVVHDDDLDDHTVGVDGDVERDDDPTTTRLLRTPTFSLIAPLAGWLAAWGVAAIASAALIESGVSLGFGFGIADGSVDVDAGFWAGLWTLVIQAGAFLFGGYIAGRMARVRATAHAALVWVLAMVATAADAIVVSARDGGSSVLAPLVLPQWAGLEYDAVVAIPMVIFALGSLAAVLIGGLLASGANRLDTRDAVTTVRR